MTFDSPIIVPKEWGHEIIISNNEKYCGKILFIKKGHCFSLQFHKIKEETFYVLEGSLLAKFSEKDDYVSPDTTPTFEMKVGDIKHIKTGYIHQLYAVEDSKIIEVSTTHYDDDTYRLSKTF